MDTFLLSKATKLSVDDKKVITDFVVCLKDVDLLDARYLAPLAPEGALALLISAFPEMALPIPTAVVDIVELMLFKAVKDAK